jgi:hypothetical protein
MSVITDRPPRNPGLYIYERSKEVIINTIAAPVVSLLIKELPPVPPKRVCDAPPNAAPISAPLPVWSKTIAINATQAVK